MSVEAALPPVEFGCSADVAFVGDVAIKTSRHDIPEAQAWELHDDVLRYAAELQTEPLPVASLRGVWLSPSPSPDGPLYRVAHAVSIIRGPSIGRLEQDAKQQAIATVLGCVGAMACQRGDPDVLRLGIDSTIRNWHINDQGQPVLIDIYPPLLKRRNGQLPVGPIPANYPHFTRYMGTKSGVIARTLCSALNPSSSRSDVGTAFRQPFRAVEDWCYDTLPQDIDPKVRDRVRRQLRMRFVPFLASAAVQSARSRIASQ